MLDLKVLRIYQDLIVINTILIIYHPRGGIPQTRNFRGHDQMLLLPSWRNLAYTWADSMAHTKVSLVTKVPLLPYVIVYMNTPTNTQEERRI